MNLKFNQVLPVLYPLIKQNSIGCFHELVAGCQVLVDPTRDIRKPVWSHATALSEAAIHGCGVTVPEVLNYHEQRHAGTPAKLLMTAT